MTFARKHWPILFLLVIPLLPLWKAVFAGESIGPFDQIRQMAPWNGPKPEQPWDVLQADAVLQFYGWRDLVFESWGRLEPPMRNPYQLAGTPLLANSQSGGFYPPHMVMGVLHVPTPIAITLLAWVHLFWAGVGAYWLARKLGAKELGGAMAGAGFSMSAFMLSWTPIASVPETVSWIPWALSCVLELIPAGRRESPEGTTNSPGPAVVTIWKYATMLALCIGMMLLAGHLQFAAYGLMATIVLAAGLVLGNRRSAAAWGGLGAVFVSLVLGGMLAAPQLGEVLNFSKDSHRRNVPTEEGYRAYLGGALSPAEAAGLLFPSLLGNPTSPSEPGSPISTYYPSLQHRGANFAETAAGIGAVAFVGLLFVPWRRLRAAQLTVVLIGVLSLLVAFETPLDRLLYFGVPGWSATGSPGRCAVLLVLSASVLAGLGVTRIELERPDRRAMTTALSIGGIVVALNAAAAFNHASSAASWIPGLEPQFIKSIEFGAIGAAIPGILILLLGASLGLQALAHKMRGAEGLLLGAAAFTPLVTLGAGFVRTGNPDLKVDLGIGTHERVAFVNDSWELLAAAPALMPPNTATILRIHDIAGYDSLMHRDSVRAAGEIVGGDAAPPTNGNIQLLKSSFDPAKLADAGVTQVFSRSALSQLGDGEESNGLYRYRLPGPGRAYSDTGPAEIIEETLNRIVVRAKGPGRLIVKDRKIGRWRASVNGDETRLVHGDWLGVSLGEGENAVVLEMSLSGGTAFAPLGALAVLGSGLFVLRGASRKRVALGAPDPKSR